MPEEKLFSNQVVIVTGAARRIGAALVSSFHEKGANILLHCHHSVEAANALAEKLNKERKASVEILVGDLRETKTLESIVKTAENMQGNMHTLINNASLFYPTPVEDFQDSQWSELMDTNVKAPYLLSLLAFPELKKNKGNIINIVDIHGERPLKQYSIYSMTKAALLMQTKSLAKEFGAAVRVNGISPGAILWPEKEATLDDKSAAEMLQRTCLKRQGTAEDIAQAATYLALADYVTGVILPVDGGRLLTL